VKISQFKDYTQLDFFSHLVMSIMYHNKQTVIVLIVQTTSVQYIPVIFRSMKYDCFLYVNLDFDGNISPISWSWNYLHFFFKSNKNSPNLLRGTHLALLTTPVENTNALQIRNILRHAPIRLFVVAVEKIEFQNESIKLELIWYFYCRFCWAVLQLIVNDRTIQDYHVTSFQELWVFGQHYATAKSTRIKGFQKEQWQAMCPLITFLKFDSWCNINKFKKYNIKDASN